MRIAVLALALFAASCGTSVMSGGGGPIGPAPGPLPTDGPIAYQCSDGTQLMVDLEDGAARVAIVGGPSMVLPSAGGDYYSNGRYAVRGSGRDVQWEVGRMAPVSCRGS